MKKRTRKLFKDESGFNLVEISIAIIVIGIILSFSIKGYGLIKQANLMATVEQINQYKVAINMFQSINGILPGLETGEFNSYTFWKDLSELNIAKIAPSGNSTSKIGGTLSVEYKNSKIIMKLSNITPAQSKHIDASIDDGVPLTGDVICNTQSCIDGDDYSKSSKISNCEISINMS